MFAFRLCCGLVGEDSLYPQPHFELNEVETGSASPQGSNDETIYQPGALLIVWLR